MRHVFIACLTFFLHAQSFALTPARPSDVICHASFYVVADVIAGRSGVFLTLQPTEIIASRADNASDPQGIVEVQTVVRAPEYGWALEQYSAKHDYDYRDPTIPSLSPKPLTDEEVTKLFLGGTFIFGVAKDGYAKIWPLRSRSEIETVLANRDGLDCPSLKAK